MLAALRAFHNHFNLLPHARCLRRNDGGDAFIFGLFTRLAAFWRIDQTFVTKKSLFARRPDKIFVAIYAMDETVLEIGLNMRRRPVGLNHEFNLWHVSAPPYI